jgi:phosphoribosylcarboxyaminoimidazole (NCAIR) mutase
MAVEPILHHVMVKEICHRKQTHTLVVRHPATYRLNSARFGLAGTGLALSAEIQGFIESVTSKPVLPLHIPQISNSRGGIDIQRKEC